MAEYEIRPDESGSGTRWPMTRGQLVSLGLVLVASIAVGVFTYQRFFTGSASSPPRSVLAQTREIEATVNTTGTVIPLQMSKLSFNTGGRLTELYVNVGDKVVKNQPLAKLDATDLSIQLQQAKAQLATAEAKLATVLAGARSEDVQTAAAQLKAAQAKLQSMSSGRAEDIAAARAQVEAARAKLRSMEIGGRPESIASARAAVETAKAKLEQLRAASPADVAAAQAAVDTATANVASAQAKLDQLRNPTDADIMAAQAALDSARSAYQSAQVKLEQLVNPTPADVAAARASLDSARNSYLAAQQKLQQALRPTEADIQAARSNVERAEANLSSAQARLDSDSRRRGQLSGVVGQGTQGNQATPGRTTVTSDTISGQIIANSTIESDVAAVNSAQVALDAARSALQQLLAGGSPADLQAVQSAADTAKANMEAAQAKLDQLLNPTPADVAAAQYAVGGARANMESAGAKLQQVLNPTPADLAAAETAMETARASLQSAQAKLAQLKNPTPQDIAIASSAVAQAEKQAELTAVPYTLEDIDAQRQAVAQAEAQLALRMLPYSQEDIEAQKQSVAQAEAQLSLRRSPYTVEDIKSAMAEVERAKAQVALAQYNLDSATLVAPFDGVVTTVNMNPGENIGGAGQAGSPIVLVNPEGVRVDVQVDETDIPKVRLGQEVKITFDALSGQQFNGKVIAVAPSGTSVQGVITYQVSLSIDDPEHRVLGGMTATANIIYAKKETALVVPNRAVQRRGRNQVVDVMVDGTTEGRTVQVGISNDQLTEILSGVNPGESVVIPVTATRPGAPGAGGGVGVGGGFGGGFGGGGGPR